MAPAELSVAHHRRHRRSARLLRTQRCESRLHRSPAHRMARDAIPTVLRDRSHLLRSRARARALRDRTRSIRTPRCHNREAFRSIGKDHSRGRTAVDVLLRRRDVQRVVLR